MSQAVNSTKVFLASWYSAAQPTGWTSRMWLSIHPAIQQQPFVILFPWISIFLTWLLLVVVARAAFFLLALPFQRRKSANIA